MPRRARACATCRQKRIKCDATMPHCQMCIRFNRKCPGPTDAPLLFVDASAYPSGKKPRAKKTPPQATSLDVARRFEDGRGIAVGVGDLPLEMAYVLRVDISPRYVVSEAFFTNLVGFFCAEGRHAPGAVRRTPSWLHAVPRMAAAPPPPSSSHHSSSSGGRSGAAASGTEALSAALRATSAAFSSLEMNDGALLHAAYGLYGSSLRHQGKVLQEKGDKVGDMNMVMTSLMLSMFESIVATTGEGFALHCVGAAKMIDNAMEQATKASKVPDRRGASSSSSKGAGRAAKKEQPEGPNPMLVNIFFHMRIQLCYVYLTTTSQHIRSDAAMTRVLLDSCGWSQDKLPFNMQIVTPFAQLLVLQTSLDPASASASSSSPATPPPALDRTTYHSAAAEVARLWHVYEEQSTGQRLCWTNAGTGHTDFRDPFTALNYAYFSACYILLDLLAPVYTDAYSGSTTTTMTMPLPVRSAGRSGSGSAGSTPPSASSTSSSSTSLPKSSSPPTPTSPSFPPPHMTDHHAVLLSVSWYLRLRDTGFAYLRLHAPLLLVALYAPRAEQRAVARGVFEEWCLGGLRGVGWLGVRRCERGEFYRVG